MLTSLMLTAAIAAPAGDQMPDFAADTWWNSIPLTIEQLRGRAIVVESFRTW